MSVQGALTWMDEVIAGHEKVSIMDLGKIKLILEGLKKDDEVLKSLVMSVSRHHPRHAKIIHETLSRLAFV